MLKVIKITILFVLKCLGIFWLARKLNRGNTSVLCYHGFAYKDEYKFRPKLFMRPESFAKRMTWLKNSPYQVISLSEAINKQHDGNCVVLTMDDGWAATKELVGDTLAEHKFPLMLYVTSYYVEKQGTVINVALAYILWKSVGKICVIDYPGITIKKKYSITKDNITAIVDELCHHIDNIDDFNVRQNVIVDIAKQLDITLFSDNQLMFRSLNTKEIQGLQKSNVEVQLHTHRHCSPQNEHGFKREISENMTYLNQLDLKEKLEHFCYPSGEYYLSQLPWLQDCDVKTATTVSPGMLTPNTDHLQIPRLLDGEDVHQLEFESEICGFSSAMRKFLS